MTLLKPATARRPHRVLIARDVRPQHAANEQLRRMLAAERKQIEDRLRETERRYQDLIDTSNELIWSLDARGRWTYVNRKGARMIYGYDPEEMIGHAFRDFLAPEYAERELRTGQPIRKGRHRSPPHMKQSMTVQRSAARASI